MAVFHILHYDTGEPVKTQGSVPASFDGSKEANQWADDRHKETGEHYIVERRETVWSTKTLEQAIRRKTEH